MFAPMARRQSQQELRYADLTFQVYILILNVMSEPFHENIIQSPTPPIHADGNVVALE
jgi:hypothetical protein